jgi:radical SAM protein with 4Fe4S-binding SPASM domain
VTPGPPRLIAWEITRACPLACRHCRASAGGVGRELSTTQCKALLKNIAALGSPIVILTGGEPLLRPDVYELAALGTELGLTMVLATCGAGLDEPAARRLLAAGVRRISISLDGATAGAHDAMRGVNGAFTGALAAISVARKTGLEFQINSTITRDNRADLPALHAMAQELGAVTFNPFLLVPTGRGRQLMDQELSPAEYEQTLVWLAEHRDGPPPVRVTCAPHYQRVLIQSGHKPDARQSKGCMGGQSFAFVSHEGVVQICGFLDVPCGDLKDVGMDFGRIWRDSEVLRRIRDIDGYHGSCGRCEFRNVCGGCRARAYAVSGDYLGPEPFCSHAAVEAPPDLDSRVLAAVQRGLSISESPYDALARELGAPPALVLASVAGLMRRGVIRRIGGVFDTRGLGYVSTLLAAKLPPQRLDAAAAVAAKLTEVTHCYSRNHVYNLWFTLTARHRARLEELRRNLEAQMDCPLHELESLELYKLRVDFSGSAPEAPPPAPVAAADLDDRQRALVRALAGDLGPSPHPFEQAARQAGWASDAAIAQAALWLRSGLMRRFGAVVRHQLLGYSANGMCVFRVRDTRAAGAHLARQADVSHCYRRPMLADFPYNLYAMLHGRSDQALLSRAADLAKAIGAEAHEVLMSLREYKKTSPAFFEQEREREC